MKNPYIIPATIIAAAILAGFWVLKSPIVVKPPDISIHQAAQEGNIEAVKQHLAAGADVNAKSDQTGSTPLHRAALEGHKEIAELLIAQGADINAKDDGDFTPLHRAAAKGLKEIAELLISKGADVNAKDKEYGGTPLHTAALTAAVEMRHEKSGALAVDGYKEIVELLIAKGADVNAKDVRSSTPLDMAISFMMRKLTADQRAAAPFLGIDKYFDLNEIGELLRKHGGKTGAELKAEGK